MDYVDFVQLNWFRRFCLRLGEGVKNLPHTLVRWAKAVWRGIAGFFAAIGREITAVYHAFVKGDYKTRLTFLIMGFGCFTRGQIVKGLLYLAAEAAFFWFLFGFGIHYLGDILTLGTNVKGQQWNEELQIYEYTQGDNSMLILLYSVFTLFIIALFLGLWLSSIRAAYKAQALVEQGKKPMNLREELASLLNQRFHVTMLTLPTVLVTLFTILPLIFMVLIAFTNYDKNHQPPGNLFTWIGTQNFRDIFWQDPLKARTFGSLLGWTLIWAVFATFTNYIFGMILALLINKKGIKFKKFWRTAFVITIAVPQFVSLMLMSQLLHDQGAVNVLLQHIHAVDSPIHFLTDPLLAKISVIVVNMWVGIPYTMLITTGILMNIPEDLYESARIDGAGPVKTFFKITLPYMLFVTTPYLITQFVGNINNFNVIYLLTGGGPLTLDYYQAGHTDLLVTWLYKQTVNEQNYSLASTIGILVFLITAVFSLIVYNTSASAKKEEEFQ